MDLPPKKPIYRFGMSKRTIAGLKKGTPGPQYDVRTRFGEGAKSVNMNTKTKRSFNLSKNADVPGPGKYKRYPKEGHLSHEKRFTCAVDMGKNKKQRFSKLIKSSEPGPGGHIVNIVNTKSSGPSFTMYPKLSEENRYFSKLLFKSKPIPVENSEKIFEKDEFFYELSHYKPAAVFANKKKNFTQNLEDVEKKKKKKEEKLRKEEDRKKYIRIKKPSVKVDYGSHTRRRYERRMERRMPEGEDKIAIPLSKLPSLGSSHEGVSFCKDSRNNVVVDSKDSEKVLYGLVSPGPKYVPNYSQIDLSIHSKRMKSKEEETLKASRIQNIPGPGTYNPKKPGMAWSGPYKGVSIQGKEKEVLDIFTNSRRKPRFIQKQLGIYSPGPKYYLGKNLGEFSPSYSIPRAGNTRIKKDKKHADRRRKMFGNKNKNDENEENEDDYDYDYEDEDFAREGGLVVEHQEGADNIYDPNYETLSSFRRSKNVIFGTTRRMPKESSSDVPGPKYKPGLTQLSQSRRSCVPKIMRQNNNNSSSSGKNSKEPKFRKRSKFFKGCDSPGVGRYYPVKSTLNIKTGTSFGGIRSQHKGKRKKKFDHNRRYLPYRSISLEKKKKKDRNLHNQQQNQLE